MGLLAHCASLTVNTIRASLPTSPKARPHFSREVGLDMTAYWQPTTARYFGRVSKERIVEAVRDGVSRQAEENIVRLKKVAMAEATETALAGKG